MRDSRAADAVLLLYYSDKLQVCRTKLMEIVVSGTKSLVVLESVNMFGCTAVGSAHSNFPTAAKFRSFDPGGAEDGLDVLDGRSHPVGAVDEA